MAPSAPLSRAKRTLPMVASVLLPVQPKKIGMRGVFIFAVSTMIFFFSSGDSIEVSPVEPIISTADVPCSAWNLSRARKAAKSTEPSLLNGVIRATNEPVSILDILVSVATTELMISRHRRPARRLFASKTPCDLRIFLFHAGYLLQVVRNMDRRLW